MIERLAATFAAAFVGGFLGVYFGMLYATKAMITTVKKAFDDER